MNTLTLLALQAVTVAEGLQSQLLNAVVSAAVGSLITVAVFRSRLDRHTDALAGFERQRKEDIENDRRENEAIRREFRELCSGQDRGRQQEMDFMRRQVETFQLKLDANERRQRYMMDLMTAVARKLDIGHRITDPIFHDHPET